MPSISCALVVLLLIMSSADASLGSCVPLSNTSFCAPFLDGKCAWLPDGVTVDERDAFLTSTQNNLMGLSIVFQDDVSFRYVWNVIR